MLPIAWLPLFSRPVLDRLRDVRRPDPLFPSQVGDRGRQLEDPVIGVLRVAKDSHTDTCVESNCGIEYTHYVDVRGLDAFLTPYVPPTSPV
jgi:hypothetical protein